MFVLFHETRNVILVIFINWFITLAKAQLGTGNFIPVNCSDSNVQTAAAFAFGPANNPNLKGMKGFSFKIFSAYEKVGSTLKLYGYRLLKKIRFTTVMVSFCQDVMDLKTFRLSGEILLNGNCYSASQNVTVNRVVSSKFAYGIVDPGIAISCLKAKKFSGC